MSNQPFELPHAVAHILLGDDSEGAFTADQMQAYARAAVEAERQAIASMVENNSELFEYGPYAIGYAIRARGKP